MLFKKAKPYDIPKYSRRDTRVDILYGPLNIYSRTVFGFVAVALFVLIDFVCLYTLWNFVMTENPTFLILISLGCAAALDIPLAVAGYALKEYHQGIKHKNETVLTLWLSVSVFAIAFVFSFVFRVVTRDLAFSMGNSTLVTNIGAETTDVSKGSNAGVLVAALYNGVVPLLTSISSFVLSYYAYDPLKLLKARFEKERVRLESNLIEAKQGIKEAEQAEDYCNTLITREGDLYSIHKERIKQEGSLLKQIARIAIMKKLNSADEISNVTASGKKINQDNALSEEMPETLKNNVEAKLNNSEE